MVSSDVSQEVSVHLPVAGGKVPESEDEEEAILQRSIRLEEVDSDVFLAAQEDLWKPLGARGVFGGQIICQALHAAILSVPPAFAVQSFHGYFLLAGDAERNIVMHINRVRDGKSFATRTVEARQRGKTIFLASLQFHKPELSHGLDVSQKMPMVPGPEGLKSDRDVYRELSEDRQFSPRVRQFYRDNLARPQRAERRIVPVLDPNDPVEYCWMRVRGKLSDEREIHLVCLAYMSDTSMLTCAYVPFGGKRNNPVSMMVSLDHSMWFHAPDSFRADEWLLFETRCVCAAGARILSLCSVWTQSGELIFTCTQEGLARHSDELRRVGDPQGPRAKL